LLDIVSANVTRMNGIINDVLNLSRRQSGAAERIVLAEFIGRICGQWQQRGKTDQQIRADIPADLQIRFDPGQLEQILDNLIGNAFRHGGEDVRIELSAGTQRDSGMPWLRVSDNG